MPNYRYNTPDYMRQNNSNGCHVGGSRTMPASVSPSTPSRSCCNIHEHDKLSGLPIAMAYVPWQEWRSLYEVEKGFRCGTIFAELNLPFCWKGGAEIGRAHV